MAAAPQPQVDVMQNNQANNNNQRHQDDIDEEEAMLECMECPVCQDLPRDIFKEPVYNCENGHVVCNSCLKNMRLMHGCRFNCPSCRIVWRGARNSVVTKALKRLYRRRMVKCKNRNCSEQGYLSALQAGHELYCLHKNVKCPGKFYNNCSFSGSLKNLVDHLKIKKCVQIATIESVGPPEENLDALEFRGKFMSTPTNVFTQGLTQTVKPILLMHRSINRAFIWLLIERKASGHWHYTAWSLLNEDALKNVAISIFIGSPAKRSFGCHFNVMSALDHPKQEALNRGECELKFDEQLRLAVDFSELSFDFVVTVSTTAEFRENLNHDSLVDFDLEKYIIDNLEGPKEERLSRHAEHVNVDLHPLPVRRLITPGSHPIEVRMFARDRPESPESPVPISDNEDDDAILARL